MLQVERQKKDGKMAGVFRILSWVILTLGLHVWSYKKRPQDGSILLIGLGATPAPVANCCSIKIFGRMTF